jgi:hypothetical protein
LGCIQGATILDQLNNYYLLKKDSAPWRYILHTHISYIHTNRYM